ncbi:Stealth protein CR4, conserved region 4 [Pelomyxa schiedti]|nr:Stealth protein CR4, conserved region 4 [Pelomyxa schiedti]
MFASRRIFGDWQKSDKSDPESGNVEGGGVGRKSGDRASGSRKHKPRGSPPAKGGSGNGTVKSLICQDCFSAAVAAFCFLLLCINVAVWLYYFRHRHAGITRVEVAPPVVNPPTVPTEVTAPTQEMPTPTVSEKSVELCDTVDVVYTWVNGSDPAHLRSFTLYGKGSNPRAFRDYGVLRFSLRSIERYMPYARNVILVTNGQIPTWLDTTSPRFRLITHNQIFPNSSDLPTFNSNAIEAHLHKIPGLAPCFLYMNDDFFLGRDTPKDHFIDPNTGGLKLYMDGFLAPETERMKTNTWHRSVAKSNDLINAYYYPNSNSTVRHNYAGHHCYFIKKHIADTIYSRWKKEFDETSHHKFRKPSDTAFPFLHANAALEEFGAQKAKAVNIGGWWTGNHSLNVNLWEKIIKRKPYCVCLQDNLDPNEASEREIQYLQTVMCSLFPDKSSFEKYSEQNPCSLPA